MATVTGSKRHLDITSDTLTTDLNVNVGAKLLIGTADANTTSTTALVLNSTEVEKRTLGSLAFDSTTLGTAATSASGDFATAAQGTNADTAHGWGNHADEGYQTSQRAISSTPTNGATTTAISSDWAFDNVKTAVPVNAVFTDTVNTFDGAYSSLSGIPSTFAPSSHTHTFNSLTSKTSGTGNYATTGKYIASDNIVSGLGSGGVALTINDGYGNANVTFNHEDGIPEQNGNSARIEVNTDSTTNAAMYFEVASGVTSGTAIQTSTALNLFETYIEIPEQIRHLGDGDTYLKFDTNRIRLVAGGTTKFDSNSTYLTSVAFSNLTSTPTTISGYGITDAFDGAYSSLTGKPTLFDGAYSSLTGTPTLFDGAYSSLSGLPTLFDGAYSSLTGTPTIPTDFDPAGTDNSTNVTLAGSYDYLTISGQEITLGQIDYDADITNLPTLGTAAATASSDYATAAQGTLANNALPKSGGTMTGHIAMQENHYVNLRFELIENASPQYILLCLNAGGNDVNGTIRMDRSSGNYQASSVEVIVSAGSSLTPRAGALRTLQVLQQSETYKLVTLTHGGNDWIAIKYTGNTYPETSGAYFTGRIKSTYTGTLLTVVSTGVTAESVFDIGATKSYNNVDDFVITDNVTLESFGAGYLKTNVNGVVSNTATIPWSTVSSTPTTISGYGITDAAAASHVHAASDITSGTFADARIASAANWNAAYNNYITGIAVTGTTTKTITLTQRDGGTISDTFTDLSGSGGDGNDFLTGVTRSGNVLTFAVSNQTNPTYTFGSAAWTASTNYATAAQGTKADSALQSGDADLTPSWVPASDPSYLTSVAFSDLTSTPTTISGYGITDALEIGTTATTALAGNTSIPVSGTDFDPVGTDNSTDVTLVTTSHDYLSISSQAITLSSIDFDDDVSGKPTTIAGYGITDAFDGAYASLSGAPTIPTDFDPAGTDNSTDVTLVTTNAGYLSISSQEITLEKIRLNEMAGGPTAGLLQTDANGNVTVDTNTYSTATGVANNADNYGGWHAGNGADTQLISSGDWVNFNGGVSISGSGTEASPYLIDLSGSYAASSHTHIPSEVGLSNLSNSGNNVAGSFTATGDITAYSDARVKENIETIPNALEKALSLRGVNFNKIGEEKRSTGVIAQEAKEVLPEVVHENEEGMLSVAYGNITGVLIEAIKEQQKQIDELKAQLDGITK